MSTLYAVDERGFIRFEVHAAQPDEKAEGFVSTPLPPDLQLPRWNGKGWEEGATAADLGARLTQRRFACSTQLAQEAERVRATMAPAGPHALAVREQRLREARSVEAGLKEELLILEPEAQARGIEVAALAAEVTAAHRTWGKQMGLVEATLCRHGELLRNAKDLATLDKLLEAARAALWTSWPVSELAADETVTPGATVEGATVSPTKGGGKATGESGATAPAGQASPAVESATVSPVKAPKGG